MYLHLLLFLTSGHGALSPTPNPNHTTTSPAAATHGSVDIGVIAERICVLHLAHGDGEAAVPKEQRCEGGDELVELDDVAAVGVHSGDR